MTADLLRRQLQASADAVSEPNRVRTLKALLHGAQTALHRASVVGIDGALRELEPELSDAETIRACRSALQQAADRIVATAKRPDHEDESTRMSV